jgi:hypothetical protein
LLDYWHVGAIVLYLKQTFEADRVGEKSIEALLLASDNCPTTRSEWRENESKHNRIPSL